MLPTVAIFPFFLQTIEAVLKITVIMFPFSMVLDQLKSPKKKQKSVDSRPNGCQYTKLISGNFLQLDSLKPKESLVIRQRYGLDGKGDRTLGEIAGNLNISREMVRKHEVKALMKLKHPARVDYLRQHLV